MSVTVTSEPGKPFACQVQASTHKLVSDVGVSLHGGNTGPTPHELIHAGMASCTAMKICARARKKNMAVTKVIIEINEVEIDDPDDAGTPKKRILKIIEDIKVEGTVSDAELAELKKAGESCPMTAWATAKKVIESVIARI